MANERALANRGRRIHPKRAKFPREFVSKARLSKLHDIMILQTKNPATLNTPVTDAGRGYSALGAESLLGASEQSSCNAHSNPTCAAYKQGSSRLRAQQLTNLAHSAEAAANPPFLPAFTHAPSIASPLKRALQNLKPSSSQAIPAAFPG